MYPEGNSSNVTWQSLVQSVAKPEGEYQNRNQDFAHPTLWALSDGAGGTGFYAADWSQYLCEHLPTIPYKTVEQVVNWYEPLSNFFFAEKRQQAEKNFADILDDYDCEGSSATLLVAWPLSAHQLRVLQYGDSVAFLLNAQGRLKERTITDLLAFTEPPYLLHSNERLIPERVYLDTWSVAEGDVLLMASDALAQWLLIQIALRDSAFQAELDAVLNTPYGLCNQIIYSQQQYDSRLDMPGLVQRLCDVCKNETAFRNFTTDLYQRGQLALDDYTLRLCLLTPTLLKP